MNKQKLSRICGWIAIILVILFVLNLIRDWYVYNTTLNSAPFSLWIAVDAVILLLPAALCGAAHFWFKPRH